MAKTVVSEYRLGQIQELWATNETQLAAPVPTNARILGVAHKADGVYVVAEAAENAECVNRRFAAFPAGAPADRPVNAAYVGMVTNPVFPYPSYFIFDYGEG